MDLVIGDADESLVKDDVLLSIRFGSVRRQVALSKASQTPLSFPALQEATSPNSFKLDLLCRVASRWLVYRAGEDSYTVSFDANGGQAAKSLTLYVRPRVEKAGTPNGLSHSSSENVLGSSLNSSNLGLNKGGVRHKVMAQNAKDYLDSHQLVNYMHAVLHAIIREQPDDPYSFMAEQLPRRPEAACQEADVAPAVAAAVAPLEEEIAKLREENAALLAEVNKLRAEKAELEFKQQTNETTPRRIRMKKTEIIRRPTLIDEEVRNAAKEDTDTESPTSPRDNSENESQRCVNRIPSHSNILSFTKHGLEKAGDHSIQEGLQRFFSMLAGVKNSSDEYRVLRQSVFSGRWVLYTAGGKAKKPSQYSSTRRAPRLTDIPSHEPRCPFCAGNELKTPNPLLAFDAAGVPHDGPELPEDWVVRVVPNIFPLMVTPLNAYGKDFTEKLNLIPHSQVARGKHSNSVLKFNETADKENQDNVSFRQIDAIGYSEVVIEHKVHNALLAKVSWQHVSLGLRALQALGRVLASRPGVRQLLYFKQYGALSGGSLVHPHMQVITLPLLTPETQNRLQRSAMYYNKFGACSVCHCLRDQPLGHGAASSRLLHESKHFLLVVPFATHLYRCTIVPKQHRCSWLEISQEEVEDLAFMLQLVMEVIFQYLDDPEYNIYFFSVDREEEVPEKKAVHWVAEVHPRFPAELGGMELASGIRVISGLPEDWAQDLRNALQECLGARSACCEPCGE